MQRCGNGLASLGSVEVCERLPTRSVVTDCRATLGGPTPPPMASSGLFLGLGPAHGQNGHENVKKL